MFSRITGIYLDVVYSLYSLISCKLTNKTGIIGIPLKVFKIITEVSHIFVSLTSNLKKRYFIMNEKKLLRSKDNRMLAGVCGGVAAYFNVDPTLVRVIYVILTFAGAAGLLLYLIMWLLIPEEK